MKKKVLIFVIALFGLIAITIGTAFAFFTFTKNGSTENTIRAGNIVFHYDEISGKGRGINLIDALPVESDEEEKGSDNYFDFRITANSSMAQIPYTISAKLSDDSNLDNTVVKVYLTKVVGANETQILYTTLDQLEERTFLNNDVQKVLYKDTVAVNGQSYEVNYRLRMWIAEGTDFTSGTYNNKKILLTVNVYTNEGHSLTKEEHYTKLDDTSIKMISANNTYLLTESSDIGVNYEVNVPNEVNIANFDIIEKNIAATSTVTELGQTLSYNGNGIIKRLTSQSSSFPLLAGDNYFKVTTAAADGKTTKDYILKVYREYNKDNNLTSLSVDGYAFTEPFDEDTLTYHVSNAVEASSITISGNKSADVAQIEGTGTKTLAWGENTFQVTVIPEDPNTQPKVYTIVVNNQRPTAPVITGGTTGDKLSINRVISMVEPGTAISGVSGYEYYKTTTNTLPDDSTVGTILVNPYTVEIQEQGTTYIYYRTVSTSGNRSLWTSAQKININPGLYDTNGNVVKTWAQLESLGLTKTSIETDYKFYTYKTATNSPYQVFTNNNLNGHLVFSNSITKIGDYTFMDCIGITSIEIPSSVVSIGSDAFENLSNLTSIKFSNGITSIGEKAFDSCTSLTSVLIPKSVTNIGTRAFSYCKNLVSIKVETENSVYDSRNESNAIIIRATNTLISGCKNTIIPSSVTSIGESAFKGSSIETIAIPNSVTTIGESAFANSSIETMAIPNSVTTIGKTAFYSCTNLKSINIPNNITSLGGAVLMDCSSLTSITIPNSLTEIPSQAFYGTGIKSITIPAGVKKIGTWAFYSCANLTSVTFADTSKQWFVTSNSTATSGTNVNITNASTNANNFKKSTYQSPAAYADLYWIRKN